MDLILELTNAIKKEMIGVFKYVPSHDNICDIKVLENGKFGSILDQWEVMYDEKLKKHVLVLKKENKVVSFCSLTSEGTWKGRDRLLGGFLLLKPPVARMPFWKKLANPVKFYESLTVDDQEESFHYREPLSIQFDWKPYELNLAERINKNELTPSQTAIAIIAADRPDYFIETVQSIAQNSIAYEMPIFGFFDKPKDIGRLGAVEKQVQEFKKLFPDGVAIKRPRNFGCGRNLIDARRQLFDYLEYKRVFIFEDDLVIDPNYLRFTLNLFNWANKHYSNVGAVQGWAWCDLNLESKLRLQKVVKATYGNWWGYCMSMQAWNSIKDSMYLYEKLFLGGEYKYRPHESIRHWFQLKLAKPKKVQGSKIFKEHLELWRERKNYFDSPPTGQDAATMHLFEQAGWLRLCPVANRGKYIGKEGIHMNSKIWIHHGLDRVQYDPLPKDEEIEEFILYQNREEIEEEEVIEGLHYIDRR